MLTTLKVKQSLNKHDALCLDEIEGCIEALKRIASYGKASGKWQAEGAVAPHRHKVEV